MVNLSYNDILFDIMRGAYVCPICQNKVTATDSKHSCKWCNTKLVWV